MSSFSPELIDSILSEINRTPEGFVTVAKPVARAMCFELLRFIKGEAVAENQKAAFIQSLTTQYCAQHIADLLVNVKQSTPPGADLTMILTYLIEQLEEMAREADASVPVAGKA